MRVQQVSECCLYVPVHGAVNYDIDARTEIYQADAGKDKRFLS